MNTVTKDAARIAETVIGLGVEPDDQCALCRTRTSACPTHAGEAVANALEDAGLLLDRVL